MMVGDIFAWEHIDYYYNNNIMAMKPIIYFNLISLFSLHFLLFGYSLFIHLFIQMRTLSSVFDTNSITDHGLPSATFFPFFSILLVRLRPFGFVCHMFRCITLVIILHCFLPIYIYYIILLFTTFLLSTCHLV